MSERVRVQVDGYLVQGKLEKALRRIVGNAAWQGRELPVIAGGRQRWDMIYVGVRGKVAVEFDGPTHYQDTLTIKDDRYKDELAKQGGYQVVRVPYWIQLTNETLGHYFGLEADVVQDFPHGFITTKVFPASFCEFGIARFERELKSLPNVVRLAVILSLRGRAKEYGIEYVLPKKLKSLLGE